MALKSALAFKELQDSKGLALTSRQTLRDYKNAISPTAQFNPEVVPELVTASKDLVDYQCYVVVSFNEMKIQGNLALNK